MSRVRLQRFPAAYRAALALSNDPDDLWDPRGWWEFLRFLNTQEVTASGPGLGLEVGDAFWFWSDDEEEQPGSYFEGLTERPSAFAPLIGALGRSGYLDTLHSYGNFSRHGGFRRGHAERAAEVLGDEGFAPRVWVNHGGAHDFQNLGTGCGDLPENPEARGAPAPEYHLDLTRKLGLRYAWVGDLTATPGQDRPLGPRDWFHAASPVRREILAHLARGFARRLAYRQILAAHPNYPTLRNPLLTTRMFRDRSVVQTFARYGDFSRAAFADLGWLLRPYFLDALEAAGGLSVIFVHWSRHPGRVFRDLPEPGLEGLRRLADRANQGRIWVTTTGRLLGYWEAHQALRLQEAEEQGASVVRLDAGPLPDGRELSWEDLAGITLQVADPKRVRVIWKGTPLAVEPAPGRSERGVDPLEAPRLPGAAEGGPAVTDWEVGEATSAERRLLFERERILFNTDSALRAEWIFDRNPAGRALVLVARTPEATIAGTRSLLPWRVLADGREVRVGQYTRTWTEPEHRNRGVSIAIGRELNRRSRELGYPLVFFFPSVQSIPGHRRIGSRLGIALERRQILGSMRFFWAGAPGFLDVPVGWLRRARSRRARGGTPWSTDPDPIATAGGLWDRMPKGPGVVGIHDATFVAWRFGSGSGREYVAWRSPVSGEPRFLAFVHRVGKRARILEVLGRADAEETASALAHLVEQLIAAGAWLVEWCPPRHGDGPGLAARAGFFPRRRGVPLGLWFNRPGEELGALGDPRTYRLTEGDSDYA